MSNQAAFALRKSGQIIPREIVDVILSNYKAYRTATFVVEGKFYKDSQRGVTSVTSFMEEQELLKEHDVLYCFGNTDGILDTSLQPFVALKENDEPSMVVALDGSYLKYKPMDSADSNDLGVFNKIIGKSIIRIQGITNDMEKTIESILSDELSRDSFLNSSTSPSAYFFMSNEGDLELLHDPAVDGNPKDFGWISPSIQELVKLEKETKPDPKQEPEKKEEPAKVDPLAALAAKRAAEKGGAPANPPTDPVKAPDPGSKTSVPAVSDKPKDEYEMVTESVPDNLTSKEKKAYLRARCGDLPKHWNEMKEVTFKRKKGTGPTAMGEALSGKDITPHHVKGPAAILDASESLLKNFKDSYLKSGDRVKQNYDVDAVLAEEKNWPSWFTRTGKTLEQAMGWSFQSYFEMAKTYPLFAAFLMQHMAWSNLKLRKQVPQKDTSTSEKIEAAEKAIEETSKPDPLAALAAARKSKAA